MTSPEAPNLGAPAADEDAELLAEFLTIDAQIRHFLAGNTAGRGLLEALYNHVLDEEIPDRLTQAVQKR